MQSSFWRPSKGEHLRALLLSRNCAVLTAQLCAPERRGDVRAEADTPCRQTGQLAGGPAGTEDCGVGEGVSKRLL